MGTVGTVIDKARAQPPQPELPPAPIDRRQLARYTLGNVALENEVLALFAGQLPEIIAGLKSTATARERHIAAHTLKGSSRTIGAWRLAELAEAAELEGKGAEGLALAPETIRGIETAAADVIAYAAREMLRG